MSRPPAWRDVLLRVAVAVAIAILLAVLVLPLIALVARLSPRELVRHLGDHDVVAALRLSIESTVIATATVIVLGLPTAWFLSSVEFRGKAAVRALIELPLVLPPTVAGLGLLLAFGRAGLAGKVLHAAGISLPFTTLAVIVAQVFVATPFFISAATAGLGAVDRGYLDAAATLRATPAYRFAHVMLPLALPSIVAGAIMSWARALGEFGATITFAGNLAGRTETMPLAVYTAMQTDLD
ncbi:MAG: ABC transporter permease, partial [Gemmatimonadales bacterium]